MKNFLNIFFVFSALSGVWWFSSYYLEQNQKLASANLAQTSLATRPNQNNTDQIAYKISSDLKIKNPDLALSSGGYLLAEMNSDKPNVLIEKNIDKQFLIASITKLMTAVVVLEHLPKNVLITISKEDINSESPSKFFKVGDTFSENDLLNAMLVESNNDAALALSRSVGQENFINLMNQKAQDISMKNTRFGNPTGFDPKPVNDLGNLSTPEDLLMLSNYILKNHPEIFTITKNDEYEVLNSDETPNHRALSTNRFLRNNRFPYEIMGSKTGTTFIALENLLLLFRDDKTNKLYLSIVLHSEHRFDDTLMLANLLLK